MAKCLRDEGGDGPHTVGEDHRADDGDEDGEDALRVRDGQDVPVAHRAARAGSCDELQQFVEWKTSFVLLQRMFLSLGHSHPVPYAILPYD